MKFTRIFAAILAIAMVFGLMTCGVSADEEPRTIIIGVWYDFYYDSTHESPEDDPGYIGDIVGQMKFENVALVEEKYNIRFEYVNLTFEGIEESINTSILAGTPDCDIYLCDLKFGVSAALNGLALDLKTVLPEDADVLSDQNILNYLDLGDGKAFLMKWVEAQTFVEATYPLAFNVEMLEDYNLEDPRDLYARGEWTWDKFIEYCHVLTQDTDGDGEIDQFGYDGLIDDTIRQLLMSNGATIAAGATETLSSTATGEVLQLISDLYNTYNVAQPYEYGDEGGVMRWRYRDGNVGFWPSASWIASSYADYDYDGSAGSTLEFETAYVQWPVGPSGDQETNKAKNSSGAYWFLPTGVEDPELVYNVYEDIVNWYHDDIEVRDSEDTLAWWAGVTASDEELQEENLEVMFDMGSREQFDVFQSLDVGFDYTGLIKGEETAAQFQEKYRQKVQDALDSLFS